MLKIRLDKKKSVNLKPQQVQLLYGYPILWFAITCILLDSARVIDVNKFGYAFFGGILMKFLDYFFRKAVPTEEKLNAS